MGREIYNFIWAPPPPPGQTARVTHVEKNTVALPPPPAQAVILFPSLLTPLIMTDGDQFFELLIAADRDLSKAPSLVNTQLKISLSLDPTKPYDPSALFGGVDGKNIVAKLAGQTMAAGSQILTTATVANGPHKFEGVLHPSAGQALANAGFNVIYAVKVDRSCLPVADAGGSVLCSTTTPEEIVVGYTRDSSDKLQTVKAKALVGKELSDRLVSKMLDRRLSGGKAGRIPGGCKYAFPPARNTLDLSRIDPQQPVQSYHPVIVFDKGEFDYASIGHLSDLHVNSRWQIVGRSQARVIEYGNAHLDESPPIGPMLSETTRSVNDVMSTVFGSAANVVVIGGDLIDHIRNAYDPDVFTRKGNTVKQLWNAVDLDSGYSEQSYPYGIDFVAFYSLVLNAIRAGKKPAFAISGNHDCYVDPFGISPRLATVRANEGIPSDLNLTFYEALLAFGPSGGLLKKTGSSFDSDWFEWFYTVFTPFKDWSHQLPKQSIVGLGWGNGEEIINPFMPGGQGRSHLPRSTDGISEAQFGLLQNAVGQASTHKVTLTTHFTFLSYDEPIPTRSSPGTQPWPPVMWAPTQGVLDPGDYKNVYEYGTFQTGRFPVMAWLHGGKIQCVLTGHSHRRGTYLLKPDGKTSLIFDASGDGIDVTQAVTRYGAAKSPAIVVSDSAGPYPRHNLYGEFAGRGSDRPGGTLVTFDGTGVVAKVKSLQAGSRPLPRAAVALDYIDVMTDYGVFVGDQLVFDPVTAQQSSGAWGLDGQQPVWFVTAQVSDHVAGWKISPIKLVFAFDDPVRGWIRVEASSSANLGQFVVGVDDTDNLRRWLTSQQAGFVSMQFMTTDPTMAQSYQWTDSWNWEAIPSTTPIGALSDGMGDGANDDRIVYTVARPTNNRIAVKASPWDVEFREVPDFAWRERTLKKYQ